MKVDVVLLPRDLSPADLAGRAVVVFDVLRATTSITAALAADVKEIRVFPTTSDASAAARSARGPAGAAPARRAPLLCGEEKCLPPTGFDLGNSPGGFRREAHAGRTAFMSTTNGTRAILAARGAASLFVGALVNAAAVAEALDRTELDVTLLCAGTTGDVAMEDMIGAGAVIDALSRRGAVQLASDRARVASRLFDGARQDLRAALVDSEGGRNVLSVQLGPDIEFAARLDSLNVVGAVELGEGEWGVVRNCIGPRQESGA